MDKLAKVRDEIEKLKSQLLRGACSSQIAMETRCKEEAYNEVLAILDSLQEEPVSKDYRERYKRIAQSEEFKKTYEGMSVGEIMHVECEKPVSDIDFEQELYKAFGQVKDFTLGMQIAKRFYEMGKNNQEHVSEDLGEYINELSKQFPEVSFAKLSMIAVMVANWQKEHLWKSADGDDLPEIDREVIALLDNGKVVFAHRPPEFWDGKNIITGKVTRNYPKTYDKGCWNIPNVKWWLDCLMPKEIEL